MDTWEYKVVRDAGGGEFEKELNELGAQGWEAVSLSEVHVPPAPPEIRFGSTTHPELRMLGSTVTSILLKRRKQ